MASGSLDFKIPKAPPAPANSTPDAPKQPAATSEQSSVVQPPPKA